MNEQVQDPNNDTVEETFVKQLSVFINNTSSAVDTLPEGETRTRWIAFRQMLEVALSYFAVMINMPANNFRQQLLHEASHPNQEITKEG